MLNAQKAKDYTSIKRIGALAPVLIATPKYDGIWACGIISGDGVESFHSRQKNSITSCDAIVEELLFIGKALPRDQKYAIIGELWKPDTAFHDISGACRRKSAQAEGMRFMVHDLVPLGDDADAPYAARYGMLARIITGMTQYGALEHTKLVRAQAVDSDKMTEYADEIIRRGGEGAIFRNPSSAYSPGSRNMDMVKLKEFKDFDLKAFKLLEGTGDAKGRVAVLMCSDLRRRNIHYVSAGALTHAERRELWTTPFTPRVIEARCMNVTPDGEMREPRFVRFRDDKTIDDIQTVE